MMNKKRLLALLLAVVMVIGMIPTVMAADGESTPETLNDNTNNAVVMSSSDENNAIVMNKGINKVSEGNYEITLEAYATGEEIPAPVDVVFVLDQSTSMFTVIDNVNCNSKDQIVGEGDAGLTYSKMLEYAKNNSDAVEQEGYYMMRMYIDASNFRNNHIAFDKSEDMPQTLISNKWYVVRTGKGRLRKTVTNGYVENQKFYYNKNKDVEGYMWFPVRWKDNKLQYNVTCLYVTTSSTSKTVSGTEWNTDERYWIDVPTDSNVRPNDTRLRFYKSIYGATYDAMMTFYNSTKDIKNLNVALVGFSEGGGIYNATKANDYKEDLDLYDHSPNNTDVQDLTSFIQEKTGNANYGSNAFAKAGTDTLRTRIKNYTPNYYGTVTDAGMALANYLFKNPNITGARADAKRFVILYTDGSPVGNMVDKYSGTDTSYQTQPIKQAYISKNTYGATVYAVTPPSAVNKAYLSCISSEYPNAKSTSEKGTINSDGENYAIAATNTTELTAAFRSLAQVIAQTQIDLGTTTVLKDIIAPSFTLPTGADKDDIKVYTAAYNGSSFGELNEYPTASVTVNGRTIDVSNFSYKDNFISATPRDGFYGRKLVVKIPIVPNPDFLGGNNVPSNGSESGIYSGDDCIGTFDVPYVDVTVNGINPVVISKDIYISQQASIPDVINIGKYAQNGGNWQVDGINNAFVDIVYTVNKKGAADSEAMTFTIPAGTAYDQMASQWQPENAETHPFLTEDTTYTVTCTVSPITQGTAEATSSPLKEQLIQVYKPVITFQDQSINLGLTPDYAEDFVQIAWQNKDRVNANVDVLGSAPDVVYGYDPVADKFTSDTDVRVTVTAVGGKNNVPADRDITQYTTFWRNACEVDGCHPTATYFVGKGGVNFKIHINKFDLTIIKKIFDDSNPDQSFMFRVTKDNDTSFVMDVVIPESAFNSGEASITIKDLIPGDYTVEELVDWSWRYTCDDADQKVPATSVQNGKTSVTFTNKRTNGKWLSGDSWAKNLWNAENSNVQRIN